MNARRKGKGRAPVWHVGWEHIEEGAAADTSPRREGTGGSRKGTGRTPTTKHAIATRMLKHASGRIGGGVPRLRGRGRRKAGRAQFQKHSTHLNGSYGAQPTQP